MPTQSRLTSPLAALVLFGCFEEERVHPNADSVLESVRIVSDQATAQAGATLTCEAVGFDPDGDALTPQFVWTIAGVAAGSGPTLVLAPGAAETGALVTCTARLTDPDGAFDEDSASLPYANATPVLTRVRIDPDSGITSASTLTCSAEATDADGETPTLRFAWRNQTTGSALGAASGLTLTPADAAPGDAIACTVQASVNLEGKLVASNPAAEVRVEELDGKGGGFFREKFAPSSGKSERGIVVAGKTTASESSPWVTAAKSDRHDIFSPDTL